MYGTKQTNCLGFVPLCIVQLQCLYRYAAAVAEVKNDEFWDYDRQLDLEAFSSQTLYDVLSRQARDVTRNLGEQKEQVSLGIR